MRKLKIIVLVLIALMGTLTSCNTPAIMDEEELYLTNTVSDFEMEVLELVNEYRLSKGMNALEFNHIAYTYASSHTTEMILDGGISHKDFDSRSSNLAKAVGADYVSENVGMHFSTAKGIVQAWINSPKHRKVMEGNFIYTAVSIGQDGSGTYYFTQLFFR